MAKRLTGIVYDDAALKARQFIDYLINDKVDINLDLPNAPGYTEFLKLLFNEYYYEFTDSENEANAREAVKIRLAEMTKTHDQIKALMEAPINEKSDDEDDEDDDGKPKKKYYAPMPPLPATIKLDLERGRSARAWIDKYITYSKYWFPGAPDIWHEGVALWILSTIVARRALMVGAGKPQITALYMVLASKSGSGKSATIDLGRRVLNQVANLGNRLVISDKMTAPLLIKEASAQIDPDYEEMDEIDQKAEKDRLRWASRMSWIFDEYGKWLSRMLNPNANPAYAGLNELLLSWHSGYGDGTRSVTGVKARIPDRKVYMSVLGCMTVSNVTDLKRFMSMLWRDGTFGRSCILYNPDPVEFVPRMERMREAGDDIVGPLKTLHNALGEPEVDVNAVAVGGNGNKKVKYVLDRRYKEEWEIEIEGEAAEMYQEYMRFMFNIGQNQDAVPEHLESNYKRFAETAGRIATLLALINNAGNAKWNRVIPAECMHAAIEITERYRQAIHNFYADVTNLDLSQSREQENKVTKYIQNAKGWHTIGRMRNKHLKTMSTQEIARALNALVESGEVECRWVENPQNGQKAPYYAMTGTMPLDKMLTDEERKALQGSEDNEEKSDATQTA